MKEQDALIQKSVLKSSMFLLPARLFASFIVTCVLWSSAHAQGNQVAGQALSLPYLQSICSSSQPGSQAYCMGYVESYLDAAFSGLLKNGSDPAQTPPALTYCIPLSVTESDVAAKVTAALGSIIERIERVNAQFPAAAMPPEKIRAVYYLDEAVRDAYPCQDN